MNSFVYIVCNVAEIPLLDINELLKFSADPVRRSDDGVNCYVKYTGILPECIKKLTTRSEEYTRVQIEAIFAKENWENRLPF